MTRNTFIILSLLLFSAMSTFTAEPEPNPIPTKQHGALYPHSLVQTAVTNAQSYEWANEIQQRIIKRAEPWLQSSDEEIRSWMFGPTISPSWMVWSDGICPSCKKDVKMYTWETDIWKHPFKVRCPHCGALFPTNDFQAFYRSGLDAHGIFDPQKADRSLLFNADHPDTDDPLHTFGVDDGEGYVEGGKRWRFIGYYLSSGQWRKKIVGGVRNLSEAYLVTGNTDYARKAAILLDRIADVYPTFDFSKIGWVYEYQGHRGYVSTWHDACEEVRELAQGYDRIFEAIKNDKKLVEFLSAKAKEFSLENKKSTFTDIQSNIENNIFRHTLNHRERIESNFPRTPIAILTIETVLNWPKNRERILGMISDILKESLIEDGMTGEKGLTGYATIFPHSFAELIARFDRLDPSLLVDLMRQFPDLHQTYRFHIDTWCLDHYYPREGDCSAFGMRTPYYCGVSFSKPATTAEPSMFHWMWRLYELTGDSDFVKILYRANDGQLDGLPHDICADNPAEFQKKVKNVIETEGTAIRLSDVKKEEWGLSILRSGEGSDRRAVWLDHDAGGRHSHRDGLNIGLFAEGLDLLPDFGYPPVGYGGWRAPKAVWYTKSAAHNTVVVDGNNHHTADGKVTMWGSGKNIHIVRVSAPELIQADQFERTVALIDVSEKQSYIIDVFHVTGGKDHAKFLSSFFGTVKTNGLTLHPSEEYGYETEMRNFQTDLRPKPGWSADWNIEDRYNDLSQPKEIHLRYTDLTYKTEASLAECWVDSGQYGGNPEWIPRVMVRRKADQALLASCFVSILEPYEKTPSVESVRRLPLSFQGKPAPCEMCGVLFIQLKDGRRHYFAFADSMRKPIGKVINPAVQLAFDGAACFVSADRNGIQRLVLCNGIFLRFGNFELRLQESTSFMEIEVQKDKFNLVNGPKDLIEFMGRVNQ